MNHLRHILFGTLLVAACAVIPAAAQQFTPYVEPPQGAIQYIWNHTGSILAWYDNGGGIRIVPPSQEYTQVPAGGEVIFIETCQPDGLTQDHYWIHGDSLMVYQDFTPLDTPTARSTWGGIKTRY